jgi:hypothetical protein
LLRIQTRWDGVAGSPFYTNLYAVGPLSTNNGNDLAAAFRTFLLAIAGQFTDELSAQIQSEILEFDESNGTVTGTGTTTQAAVVGTNAGALLPASNQLLLRWATEGIVHNRRVRGRSFMPGLVETSSDASGLPESATVTAYLNAANALLTTMTGRMRVWAQPFSTDPPNPANPDRNGSAHAITAVSVAPYWAVLRSRRD